MTFLHCEEWTAIMAALVAAMTAWAAFTSTARKLTRYSSTVDRILTIMLWWEQLAPVDKASVLKIDELVMACEDTFESEREAWLSTSMAVKLMSEASEDAAPKEDQ